MTVVGCAGHQALGQKTQRSVRQAMEVILASYEPTTLVGVSSLAVGADQIFAGEVLAVGGRLHAIIPCADYATTFTTDEDRATYERLRTSADQMTRLAFPFPSEEAFMAAGRAVVDASEVLLAVWDGGPSAGLGGTADVVAYAERQNKPIEVVWPVGATRS